MMITPHDQLIHKLFVICVLVALFVSGRITPATALVIPPLADPPSGSTLTSLSVTFTGTHTSDDLEHKLRIGTTNGGAQIYNKIMPPNHSVTVSGLPSMGTIYVWYWTRNSSGWFVNTSTYTMNVGRIWNCAAGDTACLINAITLANASGNPEVIQLAAGTYTFVKNLFDDALLLPQITGNITLKGVGPDQTIITSDVPLGRESSVKTFIVEEVATLNVSGLSIVKGGLAIRNKGNVVIEQVTISKGGPGLFNEQTGTMTLKNSTVIDNGFFQGDGGGIVNKGTMEITESTIRDNGQEFYAGINNVGRMTLKNSTVADNHAESEGGGIGNLSGGWMEISNSLIQNNDANSGGGIDNAGDMTILRSVITGNEARIAFGNGGAILNTGALTISRTVIANNTASGRGGGILNFGGDLTLDRTIIAGNQAGEVGGGISHELNGLFVTEKTVVVNNTPDNCSGCP
ncbi:MAG: hypothetical protein AB7P17_12565 [Nitrospirales bacterium]